VEFSTVMGKNTKGRLMKIFSLMEVELLFIVTELLLLESERMEIWYWKESLIQ